MQSNRSFLYGESVFTTAMLVNGRVLFFSSHLERLLKGADFLWGPFSVDELANLKERIISFLPKDIESNGLRITLSYQDQNRMILRNQFDCHAIEIDYLAFDRGNKQAAKLKSIQTADEQNLLPHFLKNSRRAQQTLMYFKSGYLDNSESLLLCGPEDEVFESSWANIFAVKNNTLYTPPCGGSVLSGIMRSKVLEYPSHQFSEVKEETFDLGWLKSCDFVFLTNALWGVIPVQKIDSTNFNLPVEEFFKFEKAILDEEIKS